MSIAVLKKKTMNHNSRMSPISGSNNGPLGFALNGTRRITGVVGQTNLGPSSNCNNFNKHCGISCCTNDYNVIKPSVKNTKGMLRIRYLKCQGNCPKPICQPPEGTQNTYIEEKHIKTTRCDSSNQESIQYNNSIIINNNSKCKHATKGAYAKIPPGAISHSEYIKEIYLKKKAYLLPPCLPSFPPPVSSINICKINYDNIDDAIKAGVYGSDYMN